jgi:hypothetical protein
MVLLLLILAIIAALLATASVPAGRINLLALAFVFYLVAVLVPIVDAAT